MPICGVGDDDRLCMGVGGLLSPSRIIARNAASLGLWRNALKFCVLPLCFSPRVCSYDGPKYEDPLRYALDRGSEALKFINSPLVLDYVHVKFSCRYIRDLPIWLCTTGGNKFQEFVS